MFPETWETLRVEGNIEIRGKTFFPREQTLSVLLYSDKIKMKKYSYNNCILIKTIQSKRF